MRIALAGYDVEGRASYQYYAKDGNEIVIYDEADTMRAATPEGVKVINGPDALHQLKSEHFDKVLRTPGLSPKKLEGVANVTSATREFFQACPAPIIGVTGTKGKGTTASLIHSILTAAGKKSWLVGNIGTPALEVLAQISKDDIVVYELSSFQLWDLDVSPHVAVVLMIEPDHLDVHADMKDYVSAKGNIRRFQTKDDFCFYHPHNSYAKSIALDTVDSVVKGTAQTFGDPNSSVVFVVGNTFFIQSHPLTSIDSLQIPGKHNIENACAAISAALAFIDNETAGEAVAEGLKSFHGLPHRLKFVREVDGVRYFDDSIATTPGSAIAAINSFEEPKVLILGGSDKGADFTELYEAITYGNVKQVITIGTMGEKIANDLRRHGYESVTELGTVPMTDIVAAAYDIAEPGDVVIMSPACASFDMFKNYSDRGEQFVAAVESLNK